ncbi:MAG: RpiB/LacA/LacB family sugar-phosphate isomerase [Patescibacteria group bacterium]
MKPSIYIVSDHAGQELKEILINEFPFLIDLTYKNTPTDDYPDFAIVLAKKLKIDPNSLGLAICGSGQGICIAINKFAHIRAGLIIKKDQVKNIKLHNNANVICLSNEFTNRNDLKEIVNDFIKFEFSNEERHIRRIKKIQNIIK